MPNRSLGTGGRVPLWRLSQSTSPHKCRSHLGFSLVNPRPVRPFSGFRRIPIRANENPPEPQLLGQGQEEEKVSGVRNSALPPLPDPVGADAEETGQETPGQPGFRLERQRNTELVNDLKTATVRDQWSPRWRFWRRKG